MNPEFPKDPRSALEASLTALLLGELPHDQAATLHQKLAQDAELAKLYERLKHTIALVRETFAAPAQQPAEPLLPLRLEEHRRQKLLEHFKTAAPEELAPPRRSAAHWLVPVACAAGMMLILSALLVPSLGKREASSRRVTMLGGSVGVSKSAPAPAVEDFSHDAVQDYLLDQGPEQRVERYAMEGRPRGAVQVASSAAVPPPEPAASAGAAIVLPKSGSPADDSRQTAALYAGRPPSSPAASTRVFYDDSSGRQAGVSEGGAYGGFGVNAPGQAAPAESRPVEIAAGDLFFSRSDLAHNFDESQTSQKYQWYADMDGRAPPAAAAATKVPAPRTGDLPLLGTSLGEQEVAGVREKVQAKTKDAERADKDASGLEGRGFHSQVDAKELRELGETLRRSAPAFGYAVVPAEPSHALTVTSEKAETAARSPQSRGLDRRLGLIDGDRLPQKEQERGRLEKKAQTLAPELDAAAPKPLAPAPVPQPEVQTADNAFSTFSLNVSDVSFKLAAASLEKGTMPEPASVRSEEFINAFDYRDSEPPPGVPVAFAWERARYPFAQNRDLLRFSIKTAALGRQPGRPLNLVLLLDNSGSMERADRVRIIREALRVLAGQLQPQDKLSVVAFARTPRLFADGAPGTDAEAVALALTELTPQGGTNLEDAMNLAYQTAVRHYLANGINRVVVLTDGAANLGNVEPEALKQKVEANRKQGIALDCFGIGWEGYNDDLLEVLSRNGDGRYGFINTPEEAATEFAGQLAGALKVAASDVKVQVEFNPARVTAYRQIGYAKHQLTKEQFRDNTVDAAEIGAAESGNALYVVEVNPGGRGPLATVRVRYKVPGTTDYREQEWPVPYTGNAEALEQASPALRLAATASAFSEWLVSSPYAAEVTPDRLLGYLGGVPEVYGADARPKKLEWMLRQAKSISGK
ncbi:MAG TPA: von Willebrand factor type A domain-containing protein [Verrucomicrobiota bacterium]|nr:von Willebrand factor type A domain-containing protein [Verrucomicrobiota bacterium]HQL78443.1 von Willebrand factor type A domain-containing protein [Verrucomicrobiota bacterium]